ncbi:MAG TPA: PEP-CTERM sorting domain-containing protein [Burkholderiales bacterium]|nr:PEP-CTERM sorting domain-containing protein [Burkholderiales bacterium]
MAQVKLEPGMQFCRSMSTALGIVLAVAAMPAAADWRNFFVPTNPAPSSDVLIPDTLLDPITELNDLPPPDLGDVPLPSDLPLTVISQLDSTPQTSSVPEPGTISLFALALLGMGFSMTYRRQRKERAAR